MILEISPEPSPGERAAIEAAVRALEERDGDGCGAWWRAGLAENLAEDEAEDGAR